MKLGPTPMFLLVAIVGVLGGLGVAVALTLAGPARAQVIQESGRSSLDPEASGAAGIGIVVIEGESLLPPGDKTFASKLGLTKGTGPGKVVVQHMHGFGDPWSGGAQLLWAPPMIGFPPQLDTAKSKIEWPFQLAKGSLYRVTLAHTVAADYGRFRVLLDDVKVAELDGFAPQVGWREKSLGHVTLGAGEHRLGLEVLGKNPASSGYLVGIDRLELVPGEKKPGLADATKAQVGGPAEVQKQRPKLQQAPDAPAQAGVGRVGLGTAGQIKSCRTSLTASVEVDPQQFGGPQFGPADLADTTLTLYLQESQAAANHINCFYASNQGDVPNLVVTVECQNAAPVGEPMHSYVCND